MEDGMGILRGEEAKTRKKREQKVINKYRQHGR